MSEKVNKWTDPPTGGFLQADDFLELLGLHHPDFLPYRAQVIPLAAALALLGDRWLEPQVQDKLARWDRGVRAHASSA